jgi:hypothetical protein
MVGLPFSRGLPCAELLPGINQQYEARRDCFIRAVADSFELHEAATPTVGAWRGCRVLAAHAKIQRKPNDEKRVFGRTQYFSFVPPAAGMFVWLKMHFDAHPAFVRGEEDGQTLEMKFWVKLAEAGVLFSPGWFFAAGENGDEARGEGHFRIAFSSVSVRVYSVVPQHGADAFCMSGRADEEGRKDLRRCTPRVLRGLSIKLSVFALLRRSLT